METKKAPLHRSQVMYIIYAVAVWWVGNTVATIGSKRVMRGGDTEIFNELTTSFTDLRWVELTVLQHLVGGVLASAWLKFTGKGVWPAHARDHVLLVGVAALGNVVGNAATNAAYSLITSSTAQVIKACEPLFTFALTLLVFRNYSNLDLSTLLSVVIIVVGAGGFLMGDATFKLWGLVAAMISNMAFPTRNIFLKKLSNVWDSPLQKFAIMSLLSMLLALPVWLVKVVFVSGVSTNRLADSSLSSLFHSVYNLASITVLESVNPVTHAILNISKRLFVITANIFYFQVPFSMTMFMSLVVLLVGCYLYQLKNSSTSKWVLMKCLLLAVFLVYLFLPIPHPDVDETLAPVPTPIKLDKVEPSMIKLSHCAYLENLQVSTAWVYDQPIPSNVLENIQTMAQHNPDKNVVVYCGTFQCVKAVSELSETRIRAEFAALKEILKGSGLEQWLADHSFNKVIAMGDFESHLQDALKVGLLLKYGGFYVSPTLNTSKSFTSIPCFQGKSTWLSGGADLLDLAYFSNSRHSFLQRLARRFTETYPKLVNKEHPFRFDFIILLNSLLANQSCADCPPVIEALKFQQITTDLTGISSKHFATLKFDTRVTFFRGANLGDEIQDFPGLQFLPFIDRLVDRERLDKAKSDDNVTIFFNAWWGSGASSWPAPSNIHPIMLSVHISGSSLHQRVLSNIDFLKRNEPIGCRDSSTLDMMRESGVSAYFSGCMTLLIRNPSVTGHRNDKIYLADVRPQYVRMLPPEIQKKAIRVMHTISQPYWLKYDTLHRFSMAYQIMKNYSEAKLVITQRIHAALPCVAMGTPVVFFNTASMPGGGGLKMESSRVSGLTPLFHTVDFYKNSKEEAQEWLNNFNWDNPPPNPDVSMAMRMKASFWDMIRQHPSMYDAAKKFGMVPFATPPLPHAVRSLVYHLVFVAEGEVLHWRYWRCLESLLYHHPTSEVVIHSNLLPRDTFAVFSEAGYSVEVRSYDLNEMLAAVKFRLTTSEKLKSREADLVGLLALYQQGGVLVDPNLILVRPIDALAMNSLVWADQANTSFNSHFMLFEKGHPFIELSLSLFPEQEATDRNSLFTWVWNQWNKTRNDLSVLPHHTIYQLLSAEQMQACLEDTEEEVSDTRMKIVEDVAFAVWLNWKATMEKMKNKSLCDHILNSFCVLCNRLH